MAIGYGIKSGLVPSGYSLYGGQPRNEQENVAYRDKYSVPTKPEINDPTGAYKQVTDRMNDINNAAAYSAFMHGRNADDDSTSDLRYQELLAKRDGLKAKIQSLMADIAYQEKLRAIEMKNDPMWDIAKQQYIMKGDSSGLESIMSRIEAEKGRKITLKSAEAAKKAEDVSKKEALTKTFRKNLALVNWAYDEMNRNEDSASRRAALTAYLDLVGSAEDLGMSMEELKASMDPQMAERLESMRYGAKPTTGPSTGNVGAQNISDLQTKVDAGIKAAKSEADFDAIMNSIKENEAMLGGPKAKEYTDLVNKVENAKKDYLDASAKAAKNEAEEEKDRQARDEIQRINNMPRGQAKIDAMDQFFEDHPNYIDGVDKDGKWNPRKKESKQK